METLELLVIKAIMAMRQNSTEKIRTFLMSLILVYYEYENALLIIP